MRNCLGSIPKGLDSCLETTKAYRALMSPAVVFFFFSNYYLQQVTEINSSTYFPDIYVCICYVLGSVLGTEDAAVNKTGTLHAFKAHILQEADNKKEVLDSNEHYGVHTAEWRVHGRTFVQANDGKAQSMGKPRKPTKENTPV